MTSMEKRLLLLVVIGVSWSVGTSARGVDTFQSVNNVQHVQPIQPANSVQVGDPNRGFTLQSGYEGYLLSSQKANDPVGLLTGDWSVQTKIALLKVFKALLVPLSTFVLLNGVKIIKVLGLVSIGALIAIPICTFTSLCTTTLAKSPFSFIKGNAVKEQMVNLAQSYMSPEKIEQATQFLQSALGTYGSASQKLPNVNNQESEPATATDSPLSHEQADEQQNEAHVD